MNEPESKSGPLKALRGRSLVLRRLIESDAEQLHHNYFRSSLFRSRYRPHDKSYSLETTRIILKEHHATMANSSSPTFEYGFFSQSELCGLMTLASIDTNAMNAEILFGIFQKSNDGLRPSVGEAILLALDLSFNHIQLHRIYAHVFSDNQRACQSIMHCGFQQEGRLREHAYVGKEFKDMDIYSCLKKDLISNKNVLKYQEKLLGYKAF